MPDQGREQAELARREVEQPVADRGPMPAAVDHDALADHDVAVGVALLLAAEQGVDPLQQHLHAERLGDVVVGAHGEADQLVAFLDCEP